LVPGGLLLRHFSRQVRAQRLCARCTQRDNRSCWEEQRRAEAGYLRS
jgi:hypothetical protein